jgi:broad specificity phosphatase PhoE
MEATILYLIRHGETDWNLNGFVQGHRDIALNSTGLQQAQLLAEELKDITFDRVYASPLLRAYDTAKHLSDDVVTDPRLRELAWGIYEGAPWSDFYKAEDEKLKKLEGLSLQEKRYFKFHDTIESYHEVYTRAKACLDDIVFKHPGQQIAVATHGGLMKSILSDLEGIEPKQIVVGNTGYVVLKVVETQYRPIHYSRIKKGNV